MDCFAGHVAAIVGAANISQCLICEAGEVSRGGNTSSCAQCAPGKFAGAPGLTECVSCEKGSYAASTGSMGCLPCPAGNFSDFDGAAECTQCSPGKYSDHDGMPFCVSCADGKHNPFSGQSLPGDCVDCSPGTYGNGTAQSTCLRADCPGGSAATKFGAKTSDDCTECEPGTYSTGGNRTSCETCPEGTYSPPGSAMCTPCPTSCATCTWTATPTAAWLLDSCCRNCADQAVCDTFAEVECHSCITASTSTTKYQLMDACSKNPDSTWLSDRFGSLSNYPKFEDANVAAALGICCNQDGVQNRTQCGHASSDALVTWHEAASACSAVGQRLCASQAEVDTGCGGHQYGGHCNGDNAPIWTSIAESTRYGMCSHCGRTEPWSVSVGGGARSLGGSSSKFFDYFLRRLSTRARLAPPRKLRNATGDHWLTSNTTRSLADVANVSLTDDRKAFIRRLVERAKGSKDQRDSNNRDIIILKNTPRRRTPKPTPHPTPQPTPMPTTPIPTVMCWDES
jgi:hypothetical protein